MKTTSIFLFLCFVFGVDCLPSFIKKCKMASPEKELNACIKENIERSKPFLNNMIPELFIPKLEPYYVKRLEGFKPGCFVLLENTQIHNMRTFNVSKVSLNLEKGTFEIDLLFPNVSYTSTYTLKGELVGIHFNSTGEATGSMFDYRMKVMTAGEREAIGEDEYLIFESATYETRIKGGGRVFLHGIVPDVEENKKINKKLNRNILDFYNYMNPALLKGIGRIVFHVVQNVFRNFALKDLFD